MADRYADPITLDHIIELRRKLAEAERQRENALDLCTSLRKDISKYQNALQEIADFEGGDVTKIWRGMRTIAYAALKETK